MPLSPHLAALACAVLTAGLVVAERVDHGLAKVVTKTGAAASFVAYALWLGAWDTAHGKWIAVGLMLSMVGDLCLLSREKTPFLAGIGAFLLAHVAYLGAFWTLGVSLPVTAIALVPFGAFAFGVWRWLAPHVGSLGPAVVAYIAVITSMVASALGSAAALPDTARVGLVAAAVAFFASDLCVARDRFVAPGWDNRLIGLPLYFGAQLLFAWFGTR